MGWILYAIFILILSLFMLYYIGSSIISKIKSIVKYLSLNSKDLIQKSTNGIVFLLKTLMFRRKVDLDTKIIIFFVWIITVGGTVCYSYIQYEKYFYLEPIYEPIETIVANNRHKLEPLDDEGQTIVSNIKDGYVIWIEAVGGYERDTKIGQIHSFSISFPTLEKINTIAVIKPSLKQSKRYSSTTTRKSPLSAKQSYSSPLELSTYLLEVWLIDVKKNQVYAYRSFEPDSLGDYYSNSRPEKSKFYEVLMWLKGLKESPG